MHISVTVKNNPGNKIIHHDFVSSALSAAESMLPHDIFSIGSPIPIKLNVDSATIALRTFITTMKRMDEKKFGAR